MLNFKTERLSVGPISQSDRENMLDLLTDSIVGRTYMLPEFESREDALPLFERLILLSQDESRFVAGIFLDGRLIGLMNDTDLEQDSIELGYALLPAFHNAGYCTEALRGAIACLFEQGFSQVKAGAFSENIASLRVMEKCGMQPIPLCEELEYRGHKYNCVYRAAFKK